MNKSIIFLGDTFLPRPYKILEPLCSRFIFNLEAPITKRGKPIPGKINLVCRDDFIEDTFGFLPTAVCLANNHIMDYGDIGFEDTINILNKKNIPFFGAGLPKRNFFNPATVNIEKKKIGLFGYCYIKHIMEIKSYDLKYSPAPLKFELIKRDIKAYRNNFDRIVINLHWGIEESNIPEVEHIKLARKLIELGADCIIGHHSHAVQPVERYKHGIIAYGLGNFIFDDLCVPRNFNHYGSSFDFYKKKQRRWNRESIGIKIDFDTMNFYLHYYYFNGENVIKQKGFYHRYAKYKLPDDFGALQKKLARHRKIKKLLSLSLRYLDNPKIPSVHGLVNIFRVLVNI